VQRMLLLAAAPALVGVAPVSALKERSGVNVWQRHVGGPVSTPGKTQGIRASADRVHGARHGHNSGVMLTGLSRRRVKANCKGSIEQVTVAVASDAADGAGASAFAGGRDEGLIGQEDLKALESAASALSDGETGEAAGAVTGGAGLSFNSVVAGALPLLGFVAMAGAGSYFKEDISSALMGFTEYIEQMGSAGYAVFMALYIGLEVLAVPAIPLTMSAGALFGSVRGTAMVSFSATVAATIAFLLARFVARDKIQAIAKQNPKFAAIDRAIGEDSFRVVALLRLSPLLPFALSNYLYGLTSVRLRPYVLASWIGMLPGTFAYVSAGTVGRTLMESGSSASASGSLMQAAAGLSFAVVSGVYVTKLASKALKDVEDLNGLEDEEGQ